jgi:hypothetical protein
VAKTAVTRWKPGFNILSPVEVIQAKFFYMNRFQVK